MSIRTKRKIRVLIVAAAAPIIGGQTVQAQRLLKSLVRNEKIDATLQPINPVFFPRLQRVKFLRTFLTWPRYVYDLFQQIPHHDVIHIFSASYLSFVIAPSPAMVVARLFGKPSILNYHSGEADEHLTRWRRSVYPTIRRFDRIVVPSEYLVQVFLKHGFHAEAIPNYAETESFEFRLRDPLRPVFISNRNFETHYNVESTLKAFRIIQAREPAARLIVVGDGPERGKLHRIAADLRLANVEFRGPVPPSAMPLAYQEADIFLNSSTIDNMPLSLLESFAAGLPIVSSDAGGIPFIVEHERTGLLVNVNDEEALAKQALRLLENQGLANRLVTAGRQELAKYSYEKVVDKWVHLYRSMAKPE